MSSDQVIQDNFTKQMMRIKQLEADVEQLSTMEFSSNNWQSDQNPIVNGNMAVNQRVNAVNVPTSGSVYTLDQWRCSQGGSTGGVVAVSQVDFGPGVSSAFPEDYGFRNALLWNQTTAGTGGAPEINNLIENVVLFDGLPVTLSFWTLCTVNYNLPVNFLQWSGTAPIASTAVQNFALTANVWKKVVYTTTLPVIPNATALTVHSCLIARILPPTATVNSLYITGVRLNRGWSPLPAVWESYETNLRRCMRYYQKTFGPGAAPVQTTNNVGRVMRTLAPTYSTVNYIYHQFMVPMRVVPAAAIYGVVGGTSGQIWNYTRSTASTAVSVGANSTESGVEFNITPGASWAGGDLAGYQATFSAEI